LVPRRPNVRLGAMTNGQGTAVPSGTRRVLAVDVASELDPATAPRLDTVLREVILDAAQSGTVSDIVIDMSGVAFMSSDGVAVLLSARQRAEKVGLRLWVEHPGHMVARVLEILRLRELLSPPDGLGSRADSGIGDGGA
jgi:anti-sigma B factor antagonist